MVVMAEMRLEAAKVVVTRHWQVVMAVEQLVARVNTPQSGPVVVEVEALRTLVVYLVVLQRLVREVVTVK